VVGKPGSELPILVALAATLPKQIDMTHEVHSLAIGWNDLLALWTRATGVVAHMHPSLKDDEGQAQPPTSIAQRIKLDKLTLRMGSTQLHSSTLADVLAFVKAQPTGRINVRGENGAGKSTLLLALKQTLRGQAYYWPTADRLSFAFSANEPLPDDEDEDDDEGEDEGNAVEVSKNNADETQTQGHPCIADAGAAINAQPVIAPKKRGFSSGEQQIAALREIVQNTRAPLYLLDEWDANLDAKNRAKAWALIDELSARARVVEISHRDQP
jgi:energy-coupling factor transporter ATP-binding protein EcfA2